jgi:hypothetical protein
MYNGIDVLKDSLNAGVLTVYGYCKGRRCISKFHPDTSAEISNGGIVWSAKDWSHGLGMLIYIG